MLVQARVLQILGTTAGRLAALVVLVVVAVNVGAVLVVLTGDFDGYPDAGWWAFRHVVDPGALSDDREWDERIIGTGLMVAGVVVFVGIVLALLTDLVQRSLERLEEQQVAVRARDHVVVLGWGSIVPPVLDEIEDLVRSGGVPPRTVVVVAPARLRSERDRIGAELRSHRHAFGTHLLFAEVDDEDVLALAQVTAAHSVVVVRDDTGAHDPVAADMDVVDRSALLTDHLERARERGSAAPRVAYLVDRDQTLGTALATLPPTFVPLVGNRVVTGMLRLALVAPPWGEVLAEPTGSGVGIEVDVVGGDVVVGRRLGDLTAVMPRRLPLCIRSPDGRVSTTGDQIVEQDDIVVAFPADPQWSAATTEHDTDIEVVDAVPDSVHVLVVGWNARVPTLIDDFVRLRGTDIRVTSVGDVDADQRRAAMSRELVDATRCRFVTERLDDREALVAVLADARPDRIVVFSSLAGPVTDPEHEIPAADARAVVTAALLAAARNPELDIVVDLFTAQSAAPLRRLAGVRVIPITTTQAYTLARFAVGEEAGQALTDVFGSDEAPPLVGRVVASDGQPRRFDAVRAAGLAAGVSVAGVVVDGRVAMAPAPDLSVPPGAELLMLRGHPPDGIP